MRQHHFTKTHTEHTHTHTHTHVWPSLSIFSQDWDNVQEFPDFVEHSISLPLSLSSSPLSLPPPLPVDSVCASEHTQRCLSSLQGGRLNGWQSRRRLIRSRTVQGSKESSLSFVSNLFISSHLHTVCPGPCLSLCILQPLTGGETVDRTHQNTREDSTPIADGAAGSVPWCV